MNLSIPPEFESFIESLVARRRFLSENEVLIEGLRLLQVQETLAEDVRIGFDQIDDGHGVDGSEALAKLRNKLADRI